MNSYKRFVVGSWAPTTLAWGRDNRTCAFRVVGHGGGLRVETRIPGGDVNPYLAFAALIASGLHGIEHGLELDPALEGNAYVAEALALSPRSVENHLHAIYKALDIPAENANPRVMAVLAFVQQSSRY